MANKRGYVDGGVKQLVIDALADGERKTLRQVADAIAPHSSALHVYGAAAHALHVLARDGFIRRDRVNCKYVYSREIV